MKSGHLLRKAEVQTTTAAEYAARVKESYSHGTYRCGPLLQLSLVGQVAEESGRYFPEFLGKGVRGIRYGLGRGRSKRCCLLFVWVWGHG